MQASHTSATHEKIFRIFILFEKEEADAKHYSHVYEKFKEVYKVHN
jgi:hypothetical protein